MNKKTLSLVGIIVGFVFVLVGILSISGVLGADTSYPGSAPYSYDAGYATFGSDYYTYSVNNAAETAGAARTTAANLDYIADFLKTFCGLFSICFGILIVCCFGIYFLGLKETEITVLPEVNFAEKLEEVKEEKVEEEIEEVFSAETEINE